MKVLRRYVRLILEQKEEERTPEQKLTELFFTPDHTSQALELARSVDIDPGLMSLMEDIFSAGHDIISIYLYYTEAYAEGDFKKPGLYDRGTGDVIIKGDSYKQRYEQARKSQQKLLDAEEAIVEYGEGIGVAPPGTFNIHPVSRGVFNGLIKFSHWPDKVKGGPKEQQEYKDAIAWAGEPK